MTSDRTSNFPTIVSGFGYSPLHPAYWRIDAATRLGYRDLSLKGATDHAFTGMHFRAMGHVARALLAPADARFAFMFVLQGEVRLIVKAAEIVKLGPLDSATRYGLGQETSVELSHDAEILVLLSAGDNTAAFGSGGDGHWAISREDEEEYVAGDGPRAYFRYRNLGVDAATGRRIHIHLVRAVQAPKPGGTGYHAHSMGQLFYVLRGWADLVVEHQPAVRMTTGDAMCLASRMKHDVPDFSADYLVLEMCVPADYETVDQSPDDGPSLG